MHPSALSAALAPLWQTVTSVDEKKQMSKKDLLIYAQGAFDIDDETHNRLMEEVKDEKVQLNFLHKVENILKSCWSICFHVILQSFQTILVLCVT